MLNFIYDSFNVVNEVINFVIIVIIIDVFIENYTNIMILKKVVLIKYIIFRYLFVLFILCN